MKQNSTNSLKCMAVIVILLCSAVALHVSIQGIGSLIYPEAFGLIWMEDVKWLQIALIIGRMIGGVAFSALMTIFILNSIRALKNGILFPICNVGVLYAAAATYFTYRFCYSNIGIVTGYERNLLLDMDDIIVPLIMIIFAIIYKVAVKVSQENSLTI